MILIKLGGSIITNKNKPLSVRRKTIEKIVCELKKVNEPMIIVHGGGSFGHYWSVKYNMHTKPAKYSVKGVSMVKKSMIDLNSIILDVFLKNKLNPYCIPPTDFMIGNKHVTKKVMELRNIAKGNFVPITFGDALWYGSNKSYILSGDKIMTIFAKVLKPRLTIFALDEDGLYSDIKNKKLIYNFKKQKPQIMQSGMDVTGGMKRKVIEAQVISKARLRVFFVNGNKPQRIVDAIKGKKFEGTLFG